MDRQKLIADVCTPDIRETAFIGALSAVAFISAIPPNVYQHNPVESTSIAAFNGLLTGLAAQIGQVTGGLAARFSQAVLPASSDYSFRMRLAGLALTGAMSAGAMEVAGYNYYMSVRETSLQEEQSKRPPLWFQVENPTQQP